MHGPQPSSRPTPYGLGAAKVAPALYDSGVRDFFVALASEGRALRPLLPDDAVINILSGHMEGEDLTGLVPVLNSPEQFFRDRTMRPGKPFAIQLDSGMNRLGMEAAEWAAIRDEALAAGPAFIMSHLACADEPDHPANAAQLKAFREMTDGCGVPRSLAATAASCWGRITTSTWSDPASGCMAACPSPMRVRSCACRCA